MTNLSSNDLKKVGQKYEVNGTTIEVVEYLTAKEQYERGLVTKTNGTQVLYRLKINGEERELKGSSFAKFCKAFGFEVEGKTGGNGGGKRKTFKERLNNLLKEFEKEPTMNDLLEALLGNEGCPVWFKKANEEEAKRIAEAQKAEEAQRRVKETIKNLIAMGYSKAEAEAIATAKTKKGKSK